MTALSRETEIREENLALAVHRNDEGAVERLIRCYQDSLFGYAVRLIQNTYDAQEVIQDVFLRAYRALAVQYDEERCRTLALRPWLFRITRNLAQNRRRARRTVLEEPLSTAEEGPRTTLRYMSMPDSIRAREEREGLERALRDLTAESRDLILLRFMEGMAYAEIAAVLGTSEASARGKVFRALRRLRALMKKESCDAM